MEKQTVKGVDYIGVSAGAMIFSDNRELFLSKRSQNTKNERGCWETPGGSVEFGETLEDAVRREIREEYGVDIEITEQFPAADHIIPKDHQHWVATTFLAKIKKGQTPTIMEPEKCDAIGWFALDALPEPLSIITKLDLREYSKRKKRSGKQNL
jgi:8-oxo-dGTP diphosphatase